MSRVSSPQAARRLVAAGTFASLLLAGCGNQYRPVVTGTNPVGPAGQPNKYAVVLSNPGSGTPGLLTFVDVFGDTVISTPSVQTDPVYLALTNNGGLGYTVNLAGTLDTFGTSNPAGLRTVDVAQTTLPSGSTPTTISPVVLSGSSGAALFIPESANSRVAALNSSGQLLQEVSVAGSPTYTVGVDGTQRVYTLSSNGSAPGYASAIENSTGSGLTVTATIPVGVNPVYGVMEATARRAFVLNKGSQSVTVINVVNNTLDTGVAAGAANVTTTGTINLPDARDAAGNTVSAANPIWADFNPATNVLVVLSAGDGVHPGVLTTISIPLCNTASTATNPSCSATNPADAAGFGTVLASVPVGVNAAQVSVLRDATFPRAYVANAGSATGSGSVSVVDINSGVVTATLPTVADASNYATPSVFGLHPSTVAATTGNPTGKVYVTSPDSRFVSIIRTETDSVETHIPVLGSGVRVVVTQQ